MVVAMSLLRMEHDTSSMRVWSHGNDTTLNSRMQFVTYKNSTTTQRRRQSSSGNNEKRLQQECHEDVAEKEDMNRQEMATITSRLAANAEMVMMNNENLQATAQNAMMIRDPRTCQYAEPDHGVCG